MKAIYKILSLCFIVVTVCFSCQKTDEYPQAGIKFQEWETNYSIQQLHQKATDSIQEVLEDLVVSGYVISSDKESSFYKTIVVQEQKTGISFLVDAYNLYTMVDYGRKIYINLKGMSYAKVNGALQVGEKKENKLIPMVEELFYQQIAISSEKQQTETLAEEIKVSQLKKNENLNRLFRLKDVQFSESSINQMYYEDFKAYMGFQTHKIEQVQKEGTSFVNTQISKYSRYANQIVSDKSGDIVGVLIKKGTSYQFVINHYSEIQLTQGRFYPFEMLGGQNLVYENQINETFESFSHNQTMMSKYINAFVQGGKHWQVRSYQGNKFLQMTSFGNSEANTESYFILPVYFQGNNKLSFQTKDGYYKGEVLQVYYASEKDFEPVSPVKLDRLIEITPHFNISKENATTYAQEFVNSGEYYFPATTVGKGYLIFRYKGNSEKTTTIQIDNILFQ